MTENNKTDIHSQPIVEPENAMPELSVNDLPYTWKEAMAQQGSAMKNKNKSK